MREYIIKSNWCKAVMQVSVSIESPNKGHALSVQGLKPGLVQVILPPNRLTFTVYVAIVTNNDSLWTQLPAVAVFRYN